MKNLIKQMSWKLILVVLILFYLGGSLLYDWYTSIEDMLWTYLVGSAFNIFIAIGLIASMNVARIVLIVYSVLVALWSFLWIAFGSLIYYRTVPGTIPDEHVDLESMFSWGISVVSGVTILLGILHLVVFGWIFIYMTSDEAQRTFKKGQDNKESI